MARLQAGNEDQKKDKTADNTAVGTWLPFAAAAGTLAFSGGYLAFQHTKAQNPKHQPAPVAQTGDTFATITSADGIAKGKHYYSLTVYYPCQQGVGPWPAMALAPGFMGGKRHLRQWGEFLAARGFIVAAMEMNNIFVDPNERGKGLVEAVDALVAENSREGSPLVGCVDTTSLGVGGWSMGGGGAQIASRLRPSLKAVLAWVPWLPKQFDLAAGGGTHVPTLLFGGDKDTTAPVEAHLDRQFAVAAGPRLKCIIRNEGHDAGTYPAQRAGEVGRLGLAWLRYFLKGDVSTLPELLQTPRHASIYVLKDVGGQNFVGTPSNCSGFVERKNPLDYSVKGYLKSWSKSSI